MSEQKPGASILSYLGLVILISSIWWTIIIRTGHVGGGGGHYVEALMWSPALAAFLTVLWRRLDPKTLGLSWGGARPALVGYLTPLAYAAVAYIIIWSLGFGGFPNPEAIAALSKRLGWTLSAGAFVPLYALLMGTTGMIGSTAHALGEEIGWRGFLAPRMNSRFGFTAGAILTGLIWTAWHAPILLFADYNAGTPAWYALPCFAVMVVSISIILTWLRLWSNSVWPCAIFHASHNLFIQGIFSPMTAPRGAVTPYAIGEFGWAVPAVAVVFAIGFWMARDKAIGQAALRMQPAQA